MSKKKTNVEKAREQLTIDQRLRLLEIACAIDKNDGTSGVLVIETYEGLLLGL